MVSKSVLIMRCVERHYKKEGPVIKNHIRKELTEDKKVLLHDKLIVMKKRKMSLDTFLDRWEKLKKAGELTKKNGRWIPRRALPKLRKKLRIPLQVRIDHTKDLKERVIKPWLGELPIVYVVGVYTSDGKRKFRGDMALHVEDDPLFEDFKKHVCSKYGPNPFRLLNSFKIRTYEFWRLVRVLIHGIANFYGSREVFRTQWGHGMVFDEDKLKELCDLYERASKEEKERYLDKIAFFRSPLSKYAKGVLHKKYELAQIRNELDSVLSEHLRRCAPFPGTCKYIRPG